MGEGDFLFKKYVDYDLRTQHRFKRTISDEFASNV